MTRSAAPPQPQQYPRATPFLTAQWLQLAMLNYVIDPALLQSLVPAETKLDDWQGHTYVSMVGFLWAHTRVMGVPIPFHRIFEEVNLRFYVRRKTSDGWRRGVVFIKELVPRWAAACVARTIYGESFEAVPMRHNIEPTINPATGTLSTARQYWRECWTPSGRASKVGGELRTPTNLVAQQHQVG